LIKLWFVLQHLRDVSLAPLLTGLLSLAAMLLLRRLAPRVPASLVVAVVATILVGLLGGEAAGVSVVGELPSGLPHLTPPVLDLNVLWELAPGALAFVLIGYAEALGAAKAAATQGAGDIDPNQAVIVVAGELTLGVLQGIALGVVLSLLRKCSAIAAGAGPGSPDPGPRPDRRSPLATADGRPSVGPAAGSGDPRRARVKLRLAQQVRTGPVHDAQRPVQRSNPALSRPALWHLVIWICL
jgi:hypothetical protein